MMNYTFTKIPYHEDDRAQRYLDIFKNLGPGQINISYVIILVHSILIIFKIVFHYDLLKVNINNGWLF